MTRTNFEARFSLSTRRRRLTSAMATMVIVGSIIGLPVLLIPRMVQLAANPQLSPSDGLLGFWCILATIIVIHLLGQGRSLRRWPGLPTDLHQLIRRMVEVSAFGVGSLGDWTMANPAVGLDRVTTPLSLAEVEAAIAADREAADETKPKVASSYPVRPTESQPSLKEAGDPRPNREHVVVRGETFWFLAEQFLADGRRWTELRDLNIDRQIKPGTYLRPGGVLPAGSRILVPESEPGVEARSSDGNDEEVSL